MAVGFALGPLGLWVRTRRWRYLFPPGPEPPGLLPGVMVGYLANNVLPLRAGELVRVYVVARRWGHGFWLILATLVVERVLDSLAIVLILAVLLLFIPVPPLLEWAALVVLLVDVVGIVVLVTLAAAPAFCRRLIERLTRRWPALRDRLTGIFEVFVDGLAGIRTPSHALPLLAWTALVWVVPAAMAWCFLAAARLSLPFLAGWTVLAFVGLGVSVPSAPGYVGVFHWAAVLAVGLFGVTGEPAVGYAILFHTANYLAVTLCGWLFLVREQLSLGEAVAAQNRQVTSR